MSLKICLNSKSPGNESNRQRRSKELWEYSSPQSILRNKNKKHVSSSKIKKKTKNNNPPVVILNQNRNFYLHVKRNIAVGKLGYYLN